MNRLSLCVGGTLLALTIGVTSYGVWCYFTTRSEKQQCYLEMINRQKQNNEALQAGVHQVEGICQKVSANCDLQHDNLMKMEAVARQELSTADRMMAKSQDTVAALESTTREAKVSLTATETEEQNLTAALAQKDIPQEEAKQRSRTLANLKSRVDAERRAIAANESRQALEHRRTERLGQLSDKWKQYQVELERVDSDRAKLKEDSQVYLKEAQEFEQEIEQHRQILQRELQTGGH
jgi:hypothetical protein